MSFDIIIKELGPDSQYKVFVRVQDRMNDILEEDDERVLEKLMSLIDEEVSIALTEMWEDKQEEIDKK